MTISADGVTLIKLSLLVTTAVYETGQRVDCQGKTYHLSSVEIKTRISATSFVSVLIETNTGLQTLILSSNEFIERMPQGSAFQVLQRVTVMNYNIAIYVSASEKEVIDMYKVFKDKPFKNILRNTLN